MDSKAELTQHEVRQLLDLLSRAAMGTLKSAEVDVLSDWLEGRWSGYDA